MFYCEKCGAVWCIYCLKSGKYSHLNKNVSSNSCPACGSMSSVKPKP